MPKKARRKTKAKPALKPETRASDDELRERLNTFDRSVLDKALAKAVNK